MSYRNRFFLVLAAPLALGLAATNPARGQPQQSNNAQSQSRSKADSSGSSVEVTGRVTQTRTVDIGEKGKKHLIAWIETSAGETQVVDLGSAAARNSVAVKKGDQITVKGEAYSVVQIRRAEVIVGSQLKTGNKTVAIEQPASQGQRELQRITGRVTKTKQVDWRKSDRRELVAMIQTDDGKEVAADLGPTTGMKGTGFRSGKTVALTGRFTRIGPARVFLASRVELGDKSINIRREWHDGTGPKAKPDDSADGNVTPANYSETNKSTEPKIQPRLQRVVELSGTVRNIKTATLKDGGRNLIALVRGEDGRYALADLGNSKTAKSYGLDQGDRLSVEGPVYRIQGRPVVITRKLSTGGKTHTVKRSD